MGAGAGARAGHFVGGSFSDKGALPGGHFNNFMKVVQSTSSNKHELNLNVTSVNRKH